MWRDKNNEKETFVFQLPCEKMFNENCKYEFKYLTKPENCFVCIKE